MSKDLHETIGGTVDALLRPRTPLPSSGVLRVAVLNDAPGGGISTAAQDAGLVVVYAPQPGEVMGDISDQSVVPPFDLLAVNLFDGAQEEAFAFALRFLRVRRPVAFVLAGENAGEFAPQAEERTRRLGYRVDGKGAFVVGALRPELFTWPSEPTARAVLAQVTMDTLAGVGKWDRNGGSSG